MGKKKLLKENERLKLQLEKSIQSNKDLESKIFDEKIKLVVETLQSIGHLDWQVDCIRDNFHPILIKKTFTFTLNI